MIALILLNFLGLKATLFEFVFPRLNFSLVFVCFVCLLHDNINEIFFLVSHNKERVVHKYFAFLSIVKEETEEIDL